MALLVALQARPQHAVVGCRVLSRRLAVGDVAVIALSDPGNPRLAFGVVEFAFVFIRVGIVFLETVVVAQVGGRSLPPIDNDVLGSAVAGAVAKHGRVAGVPQVDRGQVVSFLVPAHLPFALLGLALSLGLLPFQFAFSELDEPFRLAVVQPAVVAAGRVRQVAEQPLMHLVEGVPGPPSGAGQEVQVLDGGAPAALARIVVVALEAVLVFVADIAGLGVDVVGDRAGSARPVALVQVVVVEDPVFRLVPADLEPDPPSELAVLGILRGVTELIEAHHRAADPSHVYALVGMRIARIGVERVEVAGTVVFFAKPRAPAVPGITPDNRGLVAQRLDAEFPVVDPHNIQRLLLAETAFAGRG